MASQCIAPVNAAASEVVGTKGRYCPRGHRMGARPGEAEWASQPETGTATSPMDRVQCVSRASAVSIREAEIGPGRGWVRPQAMRASPIASAAMPTVLWSEKSVRTRSMAAWSVSSARLAMNPSGKATKIRSAVTQCRMREIRP